MNQQATAVKINGKEYPLADLSEETRAQLVNLRNADAEIAQLKNRLQMAQTAKQVYAAALQKSLPAD